MMFTSLRCLYLGGSLEGGRVVEAVCARATFFVRRFIGVVGFKFHSQYKVRTTFFVTRFIGVVGFKFRSQCARLSLSGVYRGCGA